MHTLMAFGHCYRRAFVLRITPPTLRSRARSMRAKGAAAAVADSILAFYANLLSFLHLYQEYIHKLNDQNLSFVILDRGSDRPHPSAMWAAPETFKADTQEFYKLQETPA